MGGKASKAKPKGDEPEETQPQQEESTQPTSVEAGGRLATVRVHVLPFHDLSVSLEKTCKPPD